MKKDRFYCGFTTLCLIVCFLTPAPQVFAQLSKAVELLESHAPMEAEANLTELLKAEPMNTTARYYLVLALLQQEKYTESLTELKTIEGNLKAGDPSSRPEVPSAYQYDIAMAQTYLGLKQFDKAWPELESARMEDPESSDVYLYRGIYFYSQKEYDKAVEDLEKSIKLNTDNAYAYYYAGMSYLEKKMPAKMVEVFRIFLQLAPGAPEAPAVKKLVDENC